MSRACGRVQKVPVLTLAHIWSLVEIEFEIKRSRTKRIESLEVFPATVVVVVVMSPTLLTLWIHGVLTLVKLASHLCRETEELD